MALTITVKQIGAVSIVSLEGRLALGATVEEFRETVMRHVEAGNAWIVLDLEPLVSADSAGVGEFVSVRAGIVERGGSLKLLKPSRKLKEMFHVTRLESLFEYFDNEAAAIASFTETSTAKSAAALK